VMYDRPFTFEDVERVFLALMEEAPQRPKTVRPAQ
jgi:hypothetical protein